MEQSVVVKMSAKQEPQQKPKTQLKLKPKTQLKLKPKPQQKSKTGEIDDYLSGFTEQERIVMKIAEQHLETSFDITKSIGFLEWKQSKSISK